jgi:hypothetical protein
MILLDLLSIALAAFALYQLQDLRKQHNARLTTLERREPEKRVTAPVVPVREWEKPIDNFTPKKPETLRPNQVRGREVDQNVFEFDSKM